MKRKYWSIEKQLNNPNNQIIEKWLPPDPHKPFALEISVGKKFDVLSLKGFNIKEIKDYASYLKKSAEDLYRDQNLEILDKCPACYKRLNKVNEEFSIFGVPYSKCKNCGHGFVMKRPNEKRMNAFFRENDVLSEVYIDSSSVEKRINEIVKPKLNWVKNIFLKQFSINPKSFLEVGSGGGHFVATCEREGFSAIGYELSNSSVKFAKKAFDIDLLQLDFLKVEANQEIDVIAMWGLLEYVNHPRDFIKKARNFFDKKGMIIIEVPRLDSLSTMSQILNPNNVARHMDPCSHINCFSDVSIFNALLEEGFKPVAAWYFGMDIYELMIQITISSNDKELIKKCDFMLDKLQHLMDEFRICDDIVVAAIPY